MPLKRALAWILPVMLCIAALPACAADCRPQVRDGWIRKPPADLPMMAGYARIENGCRERIVVVAASSPAFKDTSLHATVVEGGISRMRPVNQVRIEAGRTAEFKPGGMHLMLMTPTKPLRAGEQVGITFKLEDGREIKGSFEVR